MKDESRLKAFGSTERNFPPIATIATWPVSFLLLLNSARSQVCLVKPTKTNALAPTKSGRF